MSNPNFLCPQSSHSNLYSFPVPAPTDDAKIGEPPDFKKPPVHPMPLDLVGISRPCDDWMCWYWLFSLLFLL